jgi:hypothetical protein
VHAVKHLAWLAVPVCSLVVSGPAPAARADTVAAYKHRVNGLCVAATPKLLEEVRATKQAAATGVGFTAAFDRYIASAVALSNAILRVPVPAGARAEMAPLRRLIPPENALAKRATGAVHAGNLTLFRQLSAQIDAIGKTFDRIADRVGLRSCGSSLTRALNSV